MWLNYIVIRITNRLPVITFMKDYLVLYDCEKERYFLDL